ncbi:MAG: hypothetical protein P4L31_00545 [Candidatus Babeliales bacterium]|nr:hypothetical protein [Candidatus Babeliales bacterium]
MKTKNITISMPTELVSTLQSKVGKRELSKYIVKVVRKAIEEEQTSLEAAYAAAENDPDRIETINDWRPLDMEGWE